MSGKIEPTYNSILSSLTHASFIMYFQALNNLIEVQRKKSRQLIFQNISPDVFIMLKSTLKEENLSLCHSTESIFDNKTKVDCNKWTAAQVPLLESNNHRNLNLSDTEPPV